MSEMTPREIVHELNRHIIGQDKAKRAVRSLFVTAGVVCSLKKSLRRSNPKNILWLAQQASVKQKLLVVWLN